MKLNNLYNWQIETKSGDIIKQYDESGTEQSSKKILPDDVVRISYRPLISILPQHNIIIDHSVGEKFIRRFQRGFLKQKNEGFQLHEYLHCCVTNRYRVYIFSNGSILITHKDYELYL